MNYLSIGQISERTGISRRTIQDWLHRQDNPLPYYRLGKRKGIRIAEEVLDEWLKQYKEDPGQRVERLVDIRRV
ncbi:MAG TPA: helix-turn-helix domain-containing protein [Desulfatiglandales bacterium]|nr:helix-turn-helix domain-containing protein [Desulfatiglandales bacterium]